jgi:hypothetical protein
MTEKSLLDHVTSMTRAAIAARSFGRAVERLQGLEANLNSAFLEYDEAQSAMKEAGMQADVVLSPGLAAAHSSWKQDRAREAGKTIVLEDRAGS